MVTYLLEGDELVITDDREATTWRGKPLGFGVSRVLRASSTDDCIALLSVAVVEHPFRNLVRISPRGTIMWRAELPTSEPNDAYVSAELTNDELFGNTWNCYRVRLDLGTGKILSKTFTK